MDWSGYWNGVPNLDTFKNRGGSFCVIKIADGTVATKDYAINVENSKRRGLVTLGYFWLYRNIRISGGGQARAWWELAKYLDLDGCWIDYEWTYWRGVQDNPNESDLEGAAVPFEQLYGKKMMVYTAPGYLSEHPLRNLAGRKLAIAHYGVAAPSAVSPWGCNYTFWQYSEAGPAQEVGFDPYVCRAVDLDLYHGTREEFAAEFGQVAPQPSWQDLGSSIEELDGGDYHATRFDPARVDRVLDDVPNGNLPLVSVKDWMLDCTIAINGGGFMEYDTFGIPYGVCAYHGHRSAAGVDEQSIYWDVSGHPSFTRPSTLWDAINFPEKWITAGVVNQEAINSTAFDRRTLVGWKDGKEYWVVTEPMTDQRALDVALSMGLTELCCMDGGTSSGKRVNGVMVIGSDSRPVPTHMGIKPKVAGGFSMKGTVTVTNVNVKAMESGYGVDGIYYPAGHIFAGMKLNDYVYGDLNNTNPPTDIMNFTHFYKVGGVKFELPVKCKATCKGTMTITAEEEPGEPQPPTTDAIYGNFIFEETDKEGNIIATYKADGVTMPKQ